MSKNIKCYKTRKNKKQNKTHTLLYGGAAAAASLSVEPVNNSNNEVKDKSDNELLQLFLRKYIVNLNYDSIDISKFDKYLLLLINIYLSPVEKIITDKLKIELFKQLYATIINFRQIQANETLQNFRYINMHGGFVNTSLKKIRDDIVLIFLTPINRFGVQCLDNTKKILDELQLPGNRLNIQSNLLCLDKDLSNNNLSNNRDNNFSNNGDKNFFHSLLKNAITLLPGQYYYDLYLCITKKDKGLRLNIYNLDNNKSEVELNPNANGDIEYSTQLSVYIDSLPKTEKIKFLFVNCCRNIDYSIEHFNLNKNLGKDIYVYENFMLYFNTIMAGCKKIISPIQGVMLFKSKQKNNKQEEYLKNLYKIWEQKLNVQFTEFKKLFRPILYEFLVSLLKTKTQNNDEIVIQLFLSSKELFNNDDVMIQFYMKLLELFAGMEKLKTEYLEALRNKSNKDILDKITYSLIKSTDDIFNFLNKNRDIVGIQDFYYLFGFIDELIYPDRTYSIDKYYEMTFSLTILLGIKALQELGDLYNNTYTLLNKIVKEYNKKQMLEVLQEIKKHGNKRLGHLGRKTLLSKKNKKIDELEPFIHSQTQLISSIFESS
jgi:hypothetical protein